ncbi:MULTISPECIES: PTS IIA-like nitrogen regulatory protein PtsN [Rhizobium/Agrobacterium group]|uniref:PTS IIA-like nitrogen-regulatory protein PtsN n=2 Tax=Rhizobium/Agrobacterium group TaxID=227290 RepID=B9JZG6_ALLAM|nr:MULTISPECIES: PTS IIA-like nitrogen regulatory protein PtsN [Rhizobium/Agrobacterium group]MCF1499206.1 PTS IIA-like nitrogen regulatory protein PtsN [Allorhizobium sp. Av2]ACM35278.1 PTS IIA-like nitrogen-regulatory protein PtsN [Allorhizobium ampelinum S4]KAA3513647.1 PTS IIA-like nitrogen-regulatory protein PtsN [Agrobacterium vitis]KAA3528228.1 PTS IIA-like nitrogen-regulatory protein PtsN [Agrobacterium vitis]MBF2717379.1 PTS IIA-like nitrogen regulatory protein PtsN [Agrobacterium vit
MALADLLQQDAILPVLRVNSKKQLLQELAAKASKLIGIPEREIFDVILQREKLGSTGVGNGIAIPHGKLTSISTIQGVFARLETPIDFEALDEQPVDLVFLLLAPEGAGADHLKALSRIARVLRDQDLVAKLRASDSATAIYTFLNQDQASNAA